MDELRALRRAQNAASNGGLRGECGLGERSAPTASAASGGACAPASQPSSQTCVRRRGRACASQGPSKLRALTPRGPASVSTLPSRGAWVFEVKPAQVWRPRKCCHFRFLPTGKTTSSPGLKPCHSPPRRWTAVRLTIKAQLQGVTFKALAAARSVTFQVISGVGRERTLLWASGSPCFALRTYWLCRAF